MEKVNNEESISITRCQAVRYDGSICGREEFIDEKCIFHSDYIRAEKKKFNDYFWEEFERQKKEEDIYDFTGFVFPNSIDFSEVTFDNDVYFKNSKFMSSVSFSQSKFAGVITSFEGATFSGQETSFTNAKFLGEKTSFLHCKFAGKDTIFNYADFSSKSVIFNSAEFNGEYTSFILIKFSGKNFKILNAYFRNVFGLFEVLFYKIKFFKIYKYNIKVEDFRIRLGDESAIRYPLIKRMTEDEWYLKEFQNHHTKVYTIWKLSSNCGRSIFLWAVWALIIALFFGSIYADYSCPKFLQWLNYHQWLEKINPVMVIDQPNIHPENQNNFVPRIKTWFTPYYFSIVTFTTLGFGDITPANKAGEIWLALEVILGYIMLGGLISIFAVKLARRS